MLIQDEKQNFKNKENIEAYMFKIELPNSIFIGNSKNDIRLNKEKLRKHICKIKFNNIALFGDDIYFIIHKSDLKLYYDDVSSKREVPNIVLVKENTYSYSLMNLIICS